METGTHWGARGVCRCHPGLLPRHPSPSPSPAPTSVSGTSLYLAPGAPCPLTFPEMQCDKGGPSAAALRLAACCSPERVSPRSGSSSVRRAVPCAGSQLHACVAGGRQQVRIPLKLPVAKAHTHGGYGTDTGYPVGSAVRPHGLLEPRRRRLLGSQRTTRPAVQGAPSPASVGLQAQDPALLWESFVFSLCQLPSLLL